MGVIYKIFKQRKNLNMDLRRTDKLMRQQSNVATNSIIKSEHDSAQDEAVDDDVKCGDYEIEPFEFDSIEQEQSQHTTAGVDEQQEHELEQDQEQEQEQKQQQQMSAEYITQLCRFLAENACKKRAQKASIMARQQQQKITVNNFNCGLQACNQEQPQQPLSYVAATPILMDTANIRGHNRHVFEHMSNLQQAHYVGVERGIGVGVGGSLSHQQAQRQGGIKRDILLKIRNQIFERKRQRQMAHMQQQLVVWRPW